MQKRSSGNYGSVYPVITGGFKITPQSFRNLRDSTRALVPPSSAYRAGILLQKSAHYLPGAAGTAGCDVDTVDSDRAGFASNGSATADIRAIAVWKRTLSAALAVWKPTLSASCNNSHTSASDRYLDGLNPQSLNRLGQSTSRNTRSI
jgi:hypothetical protein